jgi:hypothetical protein
MDEHPRVLQVVVGDEVRLRLGGNEFVAFVEGRPNDERLAIFAQSGDELATELECWCSVGCAFGHAIKGQRDSTIAFKCDRHPHSLSVAGFLREETTKCD